eukprot:6531576-Prymnesium_polylepis.1
MGSQGLAVVLAAAVVAARDHPAIAPASTRRVSAAFRLAACAYGGYEVGRCWRDPTAPCHAGHSGALGLCGPRACARTGWGLRGLRGACAGPRGRQLGLAAS